MAHSVVIVVVVCSAKGGGKKVTSLAYLTLPYLTTSTILINYPHKLIPDDYYCLVWPPVKTKRNVYYD